jgi:CRP-like cAMP-binding protein
MGDSDPSSYAARATLPPQWEDRPDRIGAPVEVAAADRIIGRHDGAAMAVIRTGLARVFVRTAGRQVTIGYVKPGQVVALPPRDGSGSYDVEAVRRTTVLILDEVEADPVLEALAAWAYDAAVRMAVETFQPMSVRVAEHLHDLAVRDPAGRLVVDVNHHDLADSVSTVREVITRQLRALRDQGVIETRPGHVIVVNEARLEEIAAGGSPPV